MLATLEIGRQQVAIEQRRYEQATAEKDAELESLRESLKNVLTHLFETYNRF